MHADARDLALLDVDAHPLALLAGADIVASLGRCGGRAVLVRAAKTQEQTKRRKWSLEAFISSSFRGDPRLRANVRQPRQVVRSSEAGDGTVPTQFPLALCIGLVKYA